MRVVRQRMIKPFKNELPVWSLLLFLPLLGILSSCNPTEITGTNARSNVVMNDGSFDGKAYVYKDSPSIYAGMNYGPSNPDMGSFIDPKAELITNNTNLTGDCSINLFFYGDHNVSLEGCIRVLSDTNSSQVVPRREDRTFIFAPGSPEFYQTNTLYHLSLGTKTFMDKLSYAYNLIHALPLSIPKSVPSYLTNSKLFWFKAMSSIDAKLFKYDYLTAFANCTVDDGAAYFSPAGPELCFGLQSNYPGFQYVQDPSVVYHELGHALVSVMLNMRNGTSSTDYHPFRSAMGFLGYDEAKSINEGIADYYSFIINKRTHVGEWALGRTFKQSRPLDESDPMHITGIEETPEGRLSYPQYLLYDPNYPDRMLEDEHYAGQIVTHYMVALTKAFKNECSISSEADGGHDKATSYMMLLLAETLSELGDLNAKSVDDFGAAFPSNIFFNNLDKTNSWLWSQTVNPITYRKFFQVFAKNIYKYITGNLCPNFEKNESEKLLDDYGLLLFKTYNNNGNSTKDHSVDYNDAVYFIPTQGLTSVSEDNRRKSVLVSKQLIDLAQKTTENADRVGFYIIDNRSDIDFLLKQLLFKGFTVPISSGVAGVDYNNNNIKISPGEVVALIPNLVNNSNSTMAGVQLLANDWDHVDVTDDTTGNFKPCVVDTVTTVDQGAEAARTCTSTDTDYKRLIKDPTTQKFPTSAAAPACLVQLEEGTSSRWVSQNEFRKKQGLSLLDKDCLGYTTSGSSETDFTFNPHECLVRFLPSANEAFFSKIDPQKTFYESVVKQTEQGEFNYGNLLVMEVNKWIPPGTKFRCRMRARFSNCSDCYNNTENSNDDFLDYEYNGSKPYKVINFDFDVND